MSTTRQYFDTDFAHALRVNITYPAATVPCVAAIYYDPNARAAFLSFYFEDPSLLPTDFEAFLGTLKHGSSQVSLNGGIVLPSARVFHGALRVHDVHPFKIEYQFHGDPSCYSTSRAWTGIS
jgi:hypothetical protein